MVKWRVSLGSKPETPGISLNLVAEAAFGILEKKKPVPTSAQHGLEIIIDGSSKILVKILRFHVISPKMWSTGYTHQMPFHFRENDDPPSSLKALHLSKKKLQGRVQDMTTLTSRMPWISLVQTIEG